MPEYRLDVPLVDVFPHVLSYNILVSSQCIGVGSPHLSGDFVAYVQELAKIGIIVFARLIVPQRGGESLAVPALDFPYARPFGRVNIDNGCVRAAELAP